MLAGCGKKEDGAASSATPKASAGEAVAPPAGKKWSEVVSVTEKGGYRMGNPDAKIHVAEYGSFTCPHCADFAEKSNAEIEKLVDTGRMSFELRPYVRDPIDMTVALLAECGGPEPFFPLSHQLFANQATMFQQIQGKGDAAYSAAMQQAPAQRFAALAGLGGLMEFVKQRGLSEDKAKQCLTNTKQVETLAGRVQQANNDYNITGTPTLLINDTVAENVLTWDALRAKLTEAGL
jgi:protein-disulfide isomerase